MKSTKNTKDYSFRPHFVSVALAMGGKFSASHAGSLKYARTRRLSRTPIGSRDLFSQNCAGF